MAYGYVHILRFRDGKGVEHWGYRDDRLLMRQLGVANGAGQPAVAGA